jgi:hypothetical protein
MMIGHTGFEVWCDGCKVAFGATSHTVHETKTEAWRAAKAAGWTAVIGINVAGKMSNKRLHYCAKCSTKKDTHNGGS